MTADTAQAVGGHTVDSCQKGELHVTSTRYPFCFTGNPGDSNSDRDIVQFFPFNQDLNRLTLVVHHATAPQVKVTWGSESHVYTADQLEAGINLAADFVNNPFVPAFTKLDTLVYQQQQSDTNVTKVYYGAFNQMELDMPDQTADIETLRGHIIDHEKQVIATTSAPVPPVSHVITIVAATAADLAAPTAAPAAPAPAPAG